MKAVLCREFGPPETLVVEDIAEPELGPGEARVAVAACALNFFDTLIIQNRYQLKPGLPFSPGGEFSGVVEAVGEGVKSVRPGDRVIGYPGWGAAREKIVLYADRLVAVPDELDLEAAAGILIAYGTALHALKDRADLKSGETLAVLGASGGTGIAAVELGKLMGARVIACASSPDKLSFCAKHGADEGIDYAKDSLRDRLKELTDGRGVDVVYDAVGGNFAEQALRATAWLGRYLVIGFAAGDIPRIPLNLALLKGLDIKGVFWGRFLEEDPEAGRANDRQLIQWVADGKLSTPVHKRFPLDQAAEALATIARREARGKIILVP